MEMVNPGIAAEIAAAQPARPGKEQVRRWLTERALHRQPLPEPEAIRRAVGWSAADADAADRPAQTQEAA